jgi:hypothetical protein
MAVENMCMRVDSGVHSPPGKTYISPHGEPSVHYHLNDPDADVASLHTLSQIALSSILNFTTDRGAFLERYVTNLPVWMGLPRQFLERSLQAYED